MKMKKFFAVGAAKLGMFAVALGLVGSAWGATVQVASGQALQDAVAAANAGDTIQLTADVTLDATLQIGKSITLDLNGKTLSTTRRR